MIKVSNLKGLTMDHKQRAEEINKIIEEMNKNDINIDQIEQIGEFLETMKEELEKSNEMPVEMIKFDKNGQWSLDKAIKPGKPLDYGSMNTIKQKPDAHTIAYDEGKPSIENKDRAWSSKDVRSGTSPAKSGLSNRASDRAQRVKDAIASGSVIDDRAPKQKAPAIKPSSESALETIRARANKNKI
jgi:hypothetical protein